MMGRIELEPKRGGSAIGGAMGHRPPPCHGYVTRFFPRIGKLAQVPRYNPWKQKDLT